MWEEGKVYWLLFGLRVMAIVASHPSPIRPVTVTRAEIQRHGRDGWEKPGEHARRKSVGRGANLRCVSSSLGGRLGFSDFGDAICVLHVDIIVLAIDEYASFRGGRW